MKRMGILALACSAAIAVTACNRNDTAENRPAATGQSPAATAGGVLRDSPQEWVERAARANMAEIELGKLAEQRAENPQVKQFARMMVDEHTKALNELKEIASRDKIQMPAALDDDAQDTAKDLGEKRGMDFDKAYMERMIDDHQKTLDLVQDKADDLKDTQPTGTSGTAGNERASTEAERDRINRNLSQWATKTAPHMAEHLEKAKLLKNQIDK
jgi:putative membrane protein